MAGAAGALGFRAGANKLMDVNVMIFFGLVGYLMKKTEYEAAPLVLALILGPIFEKSLRQSLMVSGSFATFFTRPISCVLLIIAFLLLISATVPRKLFLNKLPADDA